MKRLIILAAVGIWIGLAYACQDITVGYLLTESAGYNPDSLVVKIVLDTRPGEPNPRFEELLNSGNWTVEEIKNWLGIPERLNVGEDYDRDRFKIPWVSVPIEGVEGTAPVMVSIKEVTSTDGDAAKMREILSVRGNGMLEVPLHHGCPVGRYVVSLNFQNEGYSKDVNNCFTIIVK